MADLTLRNIKGEPLTFDEMDSNLLALDSSINSLGAKVDSLQLDISANIGGDVITINENIDSIDGVLNLLEDNIDSEHAWNVSEHQGLTDRLDSAYAWNIVEHRQLADSIAKEHAFNIAEHDILQYNINLVSSKVDSLDSRLDSELTVIDDKFDSLALSISGNINVEIGDINVNLDSIEDRLDSAYAWNLSEHAIVNDRIDTEEQTRLLADIALGAAIDSDRAWNVVEHQALSDTITAETLARSNADSDISASIIPIVDSALKNGIISLDASPTGGSSNDF